MEENKIVSIKCGYEGEKEVYDFWTFSEFQYKSLLEIIGSPDFDFICTTPSQLAERDKKGPYCILWYDKKGENHLNKVGMRKLRFKM